MENDKLTPEEALAALKVEAKNFDTEVAHSKADDILCKLLRFLGHDDVVDEWDNVRKWYA